MAGSLVRRQRQAGRALKKTILSCRLKIESPQNAILTTAGRLDADVTAQRRQYHGGYPDDFLNNQPDISKSGPCFHRTGIQQRLIALSHFDFMPGFGLPLA